MITIKRIHIDNFKAMNNFDISFSDFSIIVGDNASGKTSILQAINFLKYACTDNVKSFMNDRHQNLSDICSQLSSKKTINFIVYFSTEESEIVWNISFAVNKAKNSIMLRSETIGIGSKIFLEYKNHTNLSSYVYDEEKGSENEILVGNYYSSILSILNDEKKYSKILTIKSFFEQSEFLDLLSPEDMRKHNRNGALSIGQRGERLSSYINSLDSDEKKELADALQEHFSFFKSIDSKTHGKGWVSLVNTENFGSKQLTISSDGMSDGMIRLIALFSLKFLKKENGLLILDEIEDGINSDNLDKLYKLLEELSSKKSFQIIVTTHSTTFLDYASPNEIIYVARKNDGNCVTVPLFDLPQMREKLEYSYVGEAILSVDNKEIKEWIFNGNKDLES